MKLSEKGYLKIGNSIVGWLENGVAKVTFDPDKIEFEADDFQGAVVLTLEEAKEISFQLYSLAMLYDTLILELDPDKELIKRVGKSYEPLNKKISQARKVMRNEQVEKKK